MVDWLNDCILRYICSASIQSGVSLPFSNECLLIKDSSSFINSLLTSLSYIGGLDGVASTYLNPGHGVVSLLLVSIIASAIVYESDVSLRISSSVLGVPPDRDWETTP